jgi:hypothetical protein
MKGRIEMVKKGDMVTIYNRTGSGKLFTEGKATLIRHLRGYDNIPSSFQRWLVIFQGDTEQVERMIDTSAS